MDSEWRGSPDASCECDCQPITTADGNLPIGNMRGHSGKCSASLKIVNKSRGSNSRRSAPPRGGGRNRDISFMNRAVQTFYVLHTLEFRKLSI